MKRVLLSVGIVFMLLSIGISSVATNTKENAMTLLGNDEKAFLIGWGMKGNDDTGNVYYVIFSISFPLYSRMVQ